MFLDTTNKKAIRTVWDSRLFAPAVARLGRNLTYFGMPGGDIQDLLDWKNILGVKTCIQRVRKGKLQQEEDLEILRKLYNNIAINELKNVQVMRGDVEDIIIKGHDLDQAVPKLSDTLSGASRFKYDIYNLDFCGGIAHPHHDKVSNVASKTLRIKAIEQLFERQRGHDFILLLTVNVRDTFGEEPLQYFQEAATRCNSSALASASEWAKTLNSGMKHHQLRLWLPAWMRELAEMSQFDCYCYPVVVYEGHEHAKMVHFAFDFRFISGRDLRIQSIQSLDAVLALPSIQVIDGQFRLTTLPGAPCAECLDDGSRLTEDLVDLQLAGRTV